MKPREIIIFTILFFAASLYSTATVVQTLTNQRLDFTSLKTAIKSPFATPAPVSAACSSDTAISGLGSSSELHMKKLAEYQQACRSLVTNEMMLFTDMPKDANDGRQRADKLVVSLQEFKKYGIKPIVVIEPVSDWGLIDFQEFDSGFYDDFLRAYFAEIKQSGLTDAELGTWVPFPEANLPYWNRRNATPADFAAIVNRYLRLLKEQYPEVEGSVLLNSATYESDDFNWTNGEYISLSSYVKGLDPNLVQSFGLQGFPWMPAANQQGSGIFDASEYLSSRLASEAADILKTKKIWLNTGAFGAKYTLDPPNTVTLSPAKRSDVLNGILSEAKKLKAQGYDVTINLFAQDKSQTTEATDWSFWGSDTVTTSPDTPVLTDFVRQTKSAGIGLSLFDM